MPLNPSGLHSFLKHFVGKKTVVMCQVVGGVVREDAEEEVYLRAFLVKVHHTRFLHGVALLFFFNQFF